MSQRRLDPGGRIDGVVIFERPAIKQSTETLMLQIADSAAVDQPTLARISFRQTTPLEKDHVVHFAGIGHRMYHGGSWMRHFMAAAGCFMLSGMVRLAEWFIQQGLGGVS